MLSVGDRLMRMSPSVSAYTAAVTFGIIHSTKFAIACDRHPTPSSLSSVLSENCGSTFKSPLSEKTASGPPGVPGDEVVSKSFTAAHTSTCSG